MQVWKSFSGYGDVSTVNTILRPELVVKEAIHARKEEQDDIIWLNFWEVLQSYKGLSFDELHSQNRLAEIDSGSHLDSPELGSM